MGFGEISDFVSAAAPPDSALDFAATLLLDTLGVTAASSRLDVAEISARTAMALYGAGPGAADAPILFDGRRASPAGAAFAGATRTDNLDGHDGYNPTKGHIGCAVVPALFAFSQAKPGLKGREALAAMVMAYEVATRAGLCLHATVSDYHTSGAWNALGVAALGARLRGLTPEQLRHAFGIAEYHGPRSQMMREIDNPSMLHDGSGMGALVGVSAVEMAALGFEGAPALTVEGPEAAPHWADLGALWTVELNYIKPYPICRWAHGAIDAVRAVMAAHDFDAEEIASIEIGAFAESARLYAGMPGATSQAQYSLPFAVAVQAIHGRIGAEHVSGEGLQDERVAALVSRTRVFERPRHSERFPAGRWSDATIRTKDGRVLESGDVNARGGPEAPMSGDEICGKFGDFTAPVTGAERAAAIWEAGRALLDDAPFADLAALTEMGG